ncbi:group 3 mite allergen-like protein [Dermatophagoides farinae]|uniref:Group 3 mite allergen-like protein n=1 Tax=Dermatophagoides farinae TaxID=6954 RepID=A0A9D4SCX0_DERFA|nr:group 3 mite allergen-like protein [Dermatophagoides farinae]
MSIKGFIPIVGLSTSETSSDDNRNKKNTVERNSYDNRPEIDGANIYDDQSLTNVQQHQAGPEDQRFIGAALQGLIGNFANGGGGIGGSKIGSIRPNYGIIGGNSPVQRKSDCICVPFYMCRNGVLVGSITDPYNNLYQQQILGRMIGVGGNRQMADKCGLLRTCCQRPYNLNSNSIPMIMNDPQQLNIDYIDSVVTPPSMSYNNGGQSIYRPPQQLPPLEHVYHQQPIKAVVNRPAYITRPPPPLSYHQRPPKVINSLHSHSIPSFDLDHHHHHQPSIAPSLPIPIRNDHLPRPNAAYHNCGQRQSIGINGRVQNLNYHQSSTEFAEYPWQVAILKRIGPSDNLYVCGGALISSSFIITAAHCIKKFQAHDLKIRLGEWDVHREDEFYPYVEKNVEEIFIHPNFVPRNLANDVALLKLDTELDLSQHPHISPICMPQTFESFAGHRCYVAGWGKNAFGHQGEYQSVLMKVDLPVLDSRMCENQLKHTKLGYGFRLDRSMICAGGEPGKDACEGDGGSGLVCESNGIWQVVGLVSWGLGCGQGGIPGVYTNVAHIRNWIDKIVLPYYVNHHNHNHHHHHNQIMISKPIPNFNELINERSLNGNSTTEILNNDKTSPVMVTNVNNNNSTQ